MAQVPNISGWQALAIAIVAAVPGSLAGLAAYNESLKSRVQSAETHALVNSRMTEMLALVRSEATAKATLAEKAKEEVKEAAKAAPLN